MIKPVFRTSLLWQCVHGGAVRRKLSTSARALMFYEPDRTGGQRKPTEYSAYEHWRDGVKIVGDEVSKFKEEVIWRFRCDHLVGKRHGDYEVAWKFDNKEMINSWVVTADRDNNEGQSTAEFVITPNHHGLFRGRLDTTVPKDGIVKRSGYCNIRSPPNFISFKRKRPYEWQSYTHLIMRVRGDGRPYQLLLRMDRRYDVQWLDIYTYVLFTRGGPYWQVAKIPFSKFILASKGRVQDKQGAVELNRILTLGITLADNATGPFHLEIDYIALLYDATHTHTFEYEMYPVSSTAIY